MICIVSISPLLMSNIQVPKKLDRSYNYSKLIMLIEVPIYVPIDTASPSLLSIMHRDMIIFKGPYMTAI